MLFKPVISLAAFAAAAAAQIKFTSTPMVVQAGTAYQITWDGAASAPVTIVLRKGISTNLGTVETITTNGVGGSYSWTPESTLVDGADYAFQIVQGTDTNYSGLFTLTGGSGVSAIVTSSIVSAASSLSAAGSSIVSSLSSSASAAASSSVSSASVALSSMVSASASASAAGSSIASVVSSSVAAASSSVSAAQTSTTSATTSRVPTSGAAGLQSPIAILLCAVVAMLYLN